MKLEGLDRHHRLIDSYKKLHVARANAVAAPVTEGSARPKRAKLASAT
jgi:hypothetical protein